MQTPGIARAGLFTTKLHKFDEALESYEKVIELDPEKEHAWNMKGIVLDSLGKYDEAIQAYNKAIEIDYANTYGAWLGGYQPAGSIEPAGDWTWISGEQFLYTNWSIDEPNNYESNDDRLIFSKSLSWNDIPHDYSAKSYVVEYEDNNSIGFARKVEWPAIDGGNGHYYEAVPTPNGITWIAANASAKALGGYLVSITSEAENRFVFSLIAGDDRYWQPNYGLYYKDAWYMKDKALYNLGKYNESLLEYDTIIKINPKNKEAWNKKGVALKALGRMKEADEAFAMANKLWFL